MHSFDEFTNSSLLIMEVHNQACIHTIFFMLCKYQKTITTFTSLSPKNNHKKKKKQVQKMDGILCLPSFLCQPVSVHLFSAFTIWEKTLLIETPSRLLTLPTLNCVVETPVSRARSPFRLGLFSSFP